MKAEYDIHRRLLYWIIGCLFFSACNVSDATPIIERESKITSDTITLLFAGDIMCHKPQVNSVFKDSAYDFSGWFQYVQPIIYNSDIAFANLETTLSTTGPYSGYPGFVSPDELAYGIADAGFDVIVTANNHSNDTRAKGLVHTIDVLRSVGMHHTGTFKDPLDKALHYPLIINQAGISIAILNYTYDTNGIETTAPTLVNMIDTIQMKEDIKQAKSMKVDAIIAFMHWGTQYLTRANYQQKRLTKLMIREGVDHIIGAHPHVVQPIEVRKSEGEEHLVAYSLGNVVSNQNKPLTGGGIMLEMKLVKTESTTKLYSWKYIPIWRYIRYSDKPSYEIIPTRAFFSDTAHFHSLNSYNEMVLYHEYIEGLLTE